MGVWELIYFNGLACRRWLQCQPINCEVVRSFSPEKNLRVGKFLRNMRYLFHLKWKRVSLLVLDGFLVKRRKLMFPVMLYSRTSHNILKKKGTNKEKPFLLYMPHQKFSLEISKATRCLFKF